MKMHETDDGDAVVVSRDKFQVYINGEWGSFNREGLTGLRNIIDQALNTSAEELEASGE